jgi:phage repressor protein C with HTH and peptisase S24 domain
MIALNETLLLAEVRGEVDRLFTVVVRGPSMVPTLRDGDALLVWRSKRIRPGQVAVVALPGVSGLSVKRAVRPAGTGWWVEGDNPFGSTDSRELGAAEVVGRVLLRWWPRLGRVR